MLPWRRQLCTGQNSVLWPHGRGQCASVPRAPCGEADVWAPVAEISASTPEGLRAWGGVPIPPAPGPWGWVHMLLSLACSPTSPQASPNCCPHPDLGPVCGNPREPCATKGSHDELNRSLRDPLLSRRWPSTQTWGGVGGWAGQGHLGNSTLNPYIRGLKGRFRPHKWLF